MSKGPLAVSWGTRPTWRPHAGAVVWPASARNTGAVAWRRGIFVAYHWLDDATTRSCGTASARRRRPSHPASVRRSTACPRPDPARLLPARLRPGRREPRLVLELGGSLLASDLEVEPRSGEPTRRASAGRRADAGLGRARRAAHAEGYAVVAGSIAWPGGILHRGPRARALRPGAGGRVPRFGSPLVCPSVLPGIELDRLDDVAGLPAFAAPQDEPWIYDGRIVLAVSGRSYSSTAIRSSTRPEHDRRRRRAPARPRRRGRPCRRGAARGPTRSRRGWRRSAA